MSWNVQDSVTRTHCHECGTSHEEWRPFACGGCTMFVLNASDLEPRISVLSQATPIVFVVDDDLSVRESLELLIKSAGWQPIPAHRQRNFSRIRTP